MPRPHKPSYFAPRGSWRFTLNGQQKYICKGIRPDQKPARDDVPRVVWDEMDRIIRESEGRASAGTDPTVFFLAQMYLDWCEAQSKDGKLTLKQYKNRCSQLGHLTHHVGNGPVRPRELSPEWMDDFFARFRSTALGDHQGPPSAHYIHNVGAAIRAMLRWASRPVSGRVPSRLIAINPLDGYGWPRQPGAVRGYVEGGVVRRFLRWAWSRARWMDNDRSGRMRGMPRTAKGWKHPPKSPEPSVEELVGVGRRAGELRPSPSVMLSLGRRFDRVFVLMIRFQRLTGCRPGEACGLRWDEIAPPPTPGVKWEPTLVTIWPGRVKTRHQSEKARKIYVTPPVARLLRALERMPGRHPEVVFPHMRSRTASSSGHHDAQAGEPWSGGTAAAKKLRELRTLAIAAGLAGVEGTGPTKLVAYSNRHGYASEGASLGFSDEQIAEQLGNTPEVMRRVYAHTIEDHAADRAAEIAMKRRGSGRKPTK